MTTVYFLGGGQPATADTEPKLGKRIKFDVQKVPAGARPSFLYKAPKGTRSVVVDVAPPPFGTVLVDVRQNATTYAVTCVPGAGGVGIGCTLFFDVE